MQDAVRLLSDMADSEAALERDLKEHDDGVLQQHQRSFHFRRFLAVVAVAVAGLVLLATRPWVKEVKAVGLHPNLVGLLEKVPEPPTQYKGPRPPEAQAFCDHPDVTTLVPLMTVLSPDLTHAQALEVTKQAMQVLGDCAHKVPCAARLFRYVGQAMGSWARHHPKTNICQLDTMQQGLQCLRNVAPGYPNIMRMQAASTEAVMQRMQGCPGIVGDVFVADRFAIADNVMSNCDWMDENMQELYPAVYQVDIKSHIMVVFKRCLQEAASEA